MLRPRQAKVVELRYIAALTFEEIGDVLGVSLRLAKRDWAVARVWLSKEISGQQKPHEQMHNILRAILEYLDEWKRMPDK